MLHPSDLTLSPIINMKTIKKIFRAAIVFFLLFVAFGAFGSEIKNLVVENALHKEWWFYIVVLIVGLFTYLWVMDGNERSKESSINKNGRDYGREYGDCQRAWKLIHKNGWTADDFTEAQQLLNDGHLRYTNNGDYIKELNKKITQESLKVK